MTVFTKRTIESGRFVRELNAAHVAAITPMRIAQSRANGLEFCGIFYTAEHAMADISSPSRRGTHYARGFLPGMERRPQLIPVNPRAPKWHSVVKSGDALFVLFPLKRVSHTYTHAPFCI